MKNYSYFLLIILSGLNYTTAYTQTIGTFNSVQPSAQVQTLVLPSTHTFQRIIQSGNSLTLGGTLGINSDFTGYVPIGGSSTNGYLSISSENTPAECAILSIAYNTGTQLWSISSSGKVNLPITDIGNTSRFCSGTVTPDNTIIVCEEATTAGDANGDGYEDIGWAIEIDPVTRTVKNQDGIGGPDKLWAVGRQSHENVCIKSDRSVIYWGADANPTGFIYKFVPAVAGLYTSGSLYVLITTSALGTGTWQLVANGTQAERNNTVTTSTALGAYNFNGIEDVELGPDGKIYFAAKGPGVVYRFNDNGTTVSNLEVFVASVNYDVDGAGPFTPEPWGIGNDNLAFDGEGNLWVLQDGDRNHIWVVGPTHTAASPKVRLFATTPAGSEPTGITFSPDYKFIFLSFQHPTTTNTASVTDASGNTVVFNNHSTIVIARKEFLGIPVCNAPIGLGSSSITNNSAIVSWTSMSGAVNYSVDYKAATSGTWINGATNTTSLSINITGLASSTIYDWRVRTNCSLSSSNYSTAQFTTTTPAVCNVPTGLTTTSITNSAATTNWSAVSGALSYDVDYKAASSGTWINAITGTISLSRNISGLTSSTLYDWRVKTNCSSGSSSYSTSQFTTTAPPICNAPTGLNTTSITSSSGTGNWTSVGGALSYDVDYKAASSATWINAVTGTTSLSRNISGLIASTLYDWRVRTNCSSGSSGYNSIQFTTTAPSPTCPGPYDISTNGTLSGAATIPFNTNILGTISPSGDQDLYKFVITTGGTITISLTTLPENYELRLLNSIGTILATSANKNNLNEIINTTVSAGSYYARVYPKANANNSLICYTLRVALGTASLINPNKMELRSVSPSLYPNPAKDKLYINLDFVESTEIKIIDIMGRLMKRQIVDGEHSVLDISIFPSGTYIISIYNNDVHMSLKFIKE